MCPVSIPSKAGQGLGHGREDHRFCARRVGQFQSPQRRGKGWDALLTGELEVELDSFNPLKGGARAGTYLEGKELPVASKPVSIPSKAGQGLGRTSSPGVLLASPSWVSIPSKAGQGLGPGILLLASPSWRRVSIPSKAGQGLGQLFATRRRAACSGT